MQLTNIFPTIILAFQITHVLSAPVSTHASTDIVKRQTTTTSGGTAGTPGRDGTSNTENVYADGNNVAGSTGTTAGHNSATGTTTSNVATSSGVNNGVTGTYNNQGNGADAASINDGTSTGNNSTSTAADTGRTTTGNSRGTFIGGGSLAGGKHKAAAHKSAGKSLLPGFSSGNTGGAITIDHSAQGTAGEDGASHTHVYVDGNGVGSSTGGAGGSGQTISQSNGRDGGDAWGWNA